MFSPDGQNNNRTHQSKKGSKWKRAALKDLRPLLILMRKCCIFSKRSKIKWTTISKIAANPEPILNLQQIHSRSELELETQRFHLLSLPPWKHARLYRILLYGCLIHGFAYRAIHWFIFIGCHKKRGYGGRLRYSWIYCRSDSWSHVWSWWRNAESLLWDGRFHQRPLLSFFEGLKVGN